MKNWSREVYITNIASPEFANFETRPNRLRCGMRYLNYRTVPLTYIDFLVLEDAESKSNVNFRPLSTMFFSFHTQTRNLTPKTQITPPIGTLFAYIPTNYNSISQHIPHPNQ